MNPAFAYFYDDFLSDKKYERELNDIEAEIANKNIGGRIARLGMFRNPREMMEDLVRGGARNIVVVGNDQTLKKVVWSSTDLNPVFGYIPIGKETEMARFLGIQPGKTSVDILAGRYIEELDVGKIEDGYFLMDVIIEDPEASVAIEGRFSVKPSEEGIMIIRNISLPDIGAKRRERKGGTLEIEIVPRVESGKVVKHTTEEAKTALHFTQARIVANKEIEIGVDGQMLTGHGFHVEILPKHLKFITGRRFMLREQTALSGAKNL